MAKQKIEYDFLIEDVIRVDVAPDSAGKELTIITALSNCEHSNQFELRWTRVPVGQAAKPKRKPYGIPTAGGALEVARRLNTGLAMLPFFTGRMVFHANAAGEIVDYRVLLGDEETPEYVLLYHLHTADSGSCYSDPSQAYDW